MKKIIFVLLLLNSFLFGQVEFKVNTFSDSTQRDPQIARDGSGNYIIVWDSENQVDPASQSDIYFQLFDSNDSKVGSEEIVNTFTEGEQERPALAMNSGGDFVIVWASHAGTSESIFDIKAKLYKNNIAVGSEILVNTFTENSQTKPDVTMLENGSFVVVWESWYQDGSNKGVYCQLFDSEGQKIGAEFLVNTTTQFSQGRPTVKHFNDGKFIVVWESWKQDTANPPGYGVYGKIYGSSGNVVVDEFQINTYVNDYQWFTDVETFTDGSFAVTWCSWEQDGHDGGIYLQKFSSTGEKTGDEILVNKSTANYQWLPKIAKHGNGNVSLVWSSWRQDGSREGVYTQLFDSELNMLSFETQVNQTTDGYQWEPTFITGDDNEILVTWSGWTDDQDYEIFARRVTTTNPQGYIAPNTYNHTAGASTTGIRVYVIDSTAITGNDYEVSFTQIGEDNFNGHIKNLTTNSDVVTDFPLNRGTGLFYLTDEFEGVAVEFIPEFEFKLDTDNSYFNNVSGTNVTFQVAQASGNLKLAPIDVQLIWGNTDTLSNGNYSTPLDTAYNINGQLIVETPFYAWSITDNEQVDLFIIEQLTTQNNRWDPGEEITLLTPTQYAIQFPNFHASINTQKPAGNIVMPGEGDINYVFTKRPLSADDKFQFQTLTSLITDAKETGLIPNKFSLKQNYPNPFNPSTTIVFSLPTEDRVRLNIYNMLGQRVSTLINEVKSAGEYKVFFDGSNLASGVYFYSIEFQNMFLSKKMLLIK